MRLEDLEFKNQRALSILLDIAQLLDLATSATDLGQKATLSRAAAVAAAVLLECMANSCLLSLAMPGRLAEELDRLPTLTKLDYYLFSCTSQHIDRGCRETELAVEVLKLRDHIVHPKPTSGRIAGDIPMQYVDYGCTNSLKVPYDMRLWKPETAAGIASAVVSFGKRFFIDWCKLERGRVTSILLAHEKQIVQGDTPTWIQLRGGDFALISRHLPESLSFLDLRDRDAAA